MIGGTGGPGRLSHRVTCAYLDPQPTSRITGRVFHRGSGSLHYVAMTLTLAQEPFSHWAPLAVLIVIALVFGLGNVILSTVAGPSRQGAVKGMVYESGMNPIGSARRRFNVRFYLVAMTFLLFDVEIVFLIPWAAVFRSLEAGSEMGLLFLGRVLFFILTSIIAFAYAWRKGVFRYD